MTPIKYKSSSGEATKMIQVYKKPAKIEGKEKQGVFYYAAYSRKGTAATIELANLMAEGSSAFTKGEVVGVTLDLPNRIKQVLLNGQAVHINGLGTFKPALTVREVKANPDELKTSAISVRSINFTPEPAFVASINAEARYEWINASNADVADDGSDDAPVVNAGGDQNSQQRPSDSQQNVATSGTVTIQTVGGRSNGGSLASLPANATFHIVGTGLKSLTAADIVTNTGKTGTYTAISDTAADVAYDNLQYGADTKLMITHNGQKLFELTISVDNRIEF